MLAQLEVTIEDVTETIPVLKPISIIGKREGCDIVLKHKSVSSQHAKLIVTYNSVTIEDLQSTNGTIIGGLRIQAPTELKDGEELQFGGVVVKLRILKQEEKSAQRMPLSQRRRPNEHSAKQSELLRVLGDGLPFKERLALLNREFSTGILKPSFHWKTRFFLILAAALLGTGLFLIIVSSLIAGNRIEPGFLMLLHEFTAENLHSYAQQGGEFSARSLHLDQHPEIIGYYLLDDIGRQLFPRRDDANPIEIKGFSASTFNGPDMLPGPNGSWYLAEVIILDNTRKGIACLQFDEKPSERGIGLSPLFLALALIFLMVSGYLFVGAAGRIITKPIAQIIIEIDEARMGQRTEFSHFKHFPELDRLARMLEKILLKSEE